MRKQMSRGKQQILFNYLPGRTFDFEGGVIARVGYIRGVQVRDLNVPMLLGRVQEQASAWPEDFRPGLRDDALRDASRFVVLDPRSVEAEFYPKVFWCENSSCGRVIDMTSRRGRARRVCPSCGGKLSQIRFVRVHRCGDMAVLAPPRCGQCQSADHMALDTRGSERIQAFRWVCRSCGAPQSMYSGNCRACDWPGDPKLKLSSIEVHRAGRTFYAHTTTLLNVPTARYAGLLAAPEWKALVGAKFLQMPGFAERRLDEMRAPADHRAADPGGVSSVQLAELFRRQLAGELSAEEMVRELERISLANAGGDSPANGSDVRTELPRFSGLPMKVWEDASQELLESILPTELAQARSLRNSGSDPGGRELIDRMGISDLELLGDFPIIVATYGFSRLEPAPRRAGRNDVLCRLNPFPPDREHGGKWPIYVDETTADAILVRLSPERVVDWLATNGVAAQLPVAENPQAAARAYIVRLLSGQQLRDTIPGTEREARLVFGLLHTIAHVMVKEAALLCGLERTSIAEYLLPKALSFAIYCNHRSGQSIGALTALFEQSLQEWLGAVRNHRRCVYDPVCRHDGGSCHACTHLSETSCRFFNMNLSRAFLFGGHDSELGEIKVGYLDVVP